MIKIRKGFIPQPKSIILPSQNQRKRASNSLNRYLDKAQKIFCVKLPVVQLVIKQLPEAFAFWDVSDKVVEIDSTLVALANEYCCKVIIPHEVAHIVIDSSAGEKPYHWHGKEFKRVLSLLT